MLSELAQYAQEHSLTARPGFKLKNVKGYVYLSADGTFQGIQVREKGAPPVYAPDISSAANGTKYCNFLVEKAKIPLCMVEDAVKDRNIPTKHAFYLSMLDSGGAYEPKFRVLAQALRSEQTRMQMVEELGKSKLKGADAIGFVVDGQILERSEAYLSWWEEFRAEKFAPAASGQALCLITGAPTVPLATVPKVSGLLSVGGHTSGDAFLCFDKDAFQSYGLKKSANAPVSEDAMTAVNAALTQLISQAPIFGGAKIVHWYAGAIPEQVDPLTDLLEGLWAEGPGNAPVPEPPDDSVAERHALTAAKQLFASLHDGSSPTALSARYYILPLSGAGGRMMIRGWYEGRFEDLYRSIGQWFTDLRLAGQFGAAYTRPPKLKALCIRLLKPGGDPLKVWERMDSELSNLSGRLLDAIIHDRPLPDEVASRALRYIRSAMLSASGEDQSDAAPNPANSIQSETLAFQLLKAWLVRRQRQRGDQQIMGENVNQSPKTPAYCCGQLMAVYGAIQSAAMPKVNVSVTERYYASASTTPAFVLGKLAHLSIHHLAMLDQDKPDLANFYRNWLDTIAAQIGPSQLPRSLDLEQQSQFALGYYQQRAAMYTNEK